MTKDEARDLIESAVLAANEADMSDVEIKAEVQHVLDSIYEDD